MRPHTLAVIGLGALGGSLAWQARLAGVPRVVGHALDRGDAAEALRADAIHQIAESAAAAAEGADLVVLAVPPAAILELLGALGSHLAPGALVTDVGSLKEPVVARACQAGLADRFAGSHPFAGTHLTGWRGAAPDRFQGATVYVCPTGASGAEAARRVMEFWAEVLGAHPVLMDAAAHDRQLAWTSHLPQAVASVLARTLAREASLRDATYASGARDATRLAAGPPEMWADILLLNRAGLVVALESFGGQLTELGRLLAKGDRAGLVAFLEQGASFRRGLEERNRAP
jgi:prephenate dehydrogenase